MVSILEKATDLFAARGFEASIMDEVAEAAACTRRTLYRYFPTKDELFWRCFGRAVGLVLERQRLTARACVTARLRARDYLAAWAGAYLDFAVERPAEFRLVMEGRERASTAGASGLPLTDATLGWLIAFQGDVKEGVSLLGRLIEEEGGCSAGEGAAHAGSFLVVLLATVEFHSRYREVGIPFSSDEVRSLRNFLCGLARSFDFASTPEISGAKEQA